MDAQHQPTRDAEILARLLARCADHDQLAFASLYDAMSSRVYGLALRILRDPCHAEEVAQDTFLHIWCSADQFDSRRGHPHSWIFTIAHRKAVDRVRKTETARRRDELHRSRSGEVPHDITSETACARVDAEPLHAVWSRVTPKCREALDLAYFGGHTHREVASALGIPDGTAKSRIREGLIQLRSALGTRP